jgi:hypothetical protein
MVAVKEDATVGSRQSRYGSGTNLATSRRRDEITTLLCNYSPDIFQVPLSPKGLGRANSEDAHPRDFREEVVLANTLTAARYSGSFIHESSELIFLPPIEMAGLADGKPKAKGHADADHGRSQAKRGDAEHQRADLAAEEKCRRENERAGEHA